VLDELGSEFFQGLVCVQKQQFSAFVNASCKLALLFAE